MGQFVMIAVGVAGRVVELAQMAADPCRFWTRFNVAWQLAIGRTLYTDIAYFKGPFSPYLNAVWLRLFSVGLTTLIVCNVVILCGVNYLLYQILFAHR